MTDIPTLRFVFRAALRIALPYFRSDERWIARGLLASIVGAQLALVGAAVATNYWRNAFFQTLQERDWPGFVQQFQVYCVIGVGFILATVYQRYLNQWLTIRWRRWLTTRYLDDWLDGPVHYRAMIAPDRVDNPDQRIAEDVKGFIDTSLSLTVGLIGAVASLFSFVAILWTLSEIAPLTVFGKTFVVPGYLVWAALLYAVLGSMVTHGIGRRLIPLDFEQERREADFRFALVHTRQNGEAIALLRGEGAERRDLRARFRAIMGNWYLVMRWQQFVGLFSHGYKYYSVYFPYLALAPLYFGGRMQFGALMQAGQAFNAVRASFSYFIESYLKIAELSAIVQRLAQFDAAMRGAGLPPPIAAPGETVAEAAASPMVLIRDLVVTAPDGTRIAAPGDLNLRSGEAVLITGASGAGKTSLLRSVAGIWPYATGGLQTTALRPLALPQRAYIPLGSLRRALAYPQDEGALTNADLNAALAAVGLSRFSRSLDDIDAWDKRLSEGEKQRLSVARALLFRPDLLLLDEATAALDEQSEIDLHGLIRAHLPGTTILAVSHRGALFGSYDRAIRIDPPSKPEERAVSLRSPFSVG